MAFLGQKETLASLDNLDHLAFLEQRGTKDKQGFPASKDQQVCLVEMVLLEYLAQKETLDCLDYLDVKVSLEPQALRDPLDLSGSLVFLVFPPRETKDKPVCQEFLARRVFPAFLEQKVIADWMVFLA